MQNLIFLALTLVVLGPVHWYLWKRLVKDTTTTKRWRRAGTVAILALAVSLLGAFILPRVIGAKFSFTATLFGYMWLAVLFYLVLIMLVLEVPRLFFRKRPLPVAAFDGVAKTAEAIADPDAPSNPDRRLLFSRGAAITAGLAAASVTGYGVKTALGPPVLKRVQIPLSKLPRSMDGYRIALVSDIHLGPLTGIEHTRRIVDSINGMNADLIAICGDLVDGSVAELRDEAAPLRDLIAKDGKFFVTGNHEYYSGAGEWLEEVQRLGIRPLRNERLEIGGMDLAGVDDITGSQFDLGGPDFAKALGDRDTTKAVVLLAHQPVQAHTAAQFGVDLQLSGHTHGGQMVPFNLIARLQQPVISGLGEVDGTKVYVTNGAGFWGPPVRVGAPPDITLVELRNG